MPINWGTTCLGNICKLTNGEKESGVERINLDVKYLRGEKEGKTLTSGKFIPRNTQMILVDGENSGEVFKTLIDGYQGSTFKRLEIHPLMNEEYVLLFIKMHQKTFRESKTGSAIPHLNKKLFNEVTIPIPPCSEQKLIVKAVQNMLNLIDIVSENL